MTIAEERRESVMKMVEELGLLGAKERQLGGRFPSALVEEAKRRSGISETTELLTYALAKVVVDDDYGERLLAHTGKVPKGVLFEG